MEWLLHEDSMAEVRQFARIGFVPTAEQRAAFEAEVAAQSGTPRNLSIAGTEAAIGIEGILTDRPSFFSFFGGARTSYADIREALAIADADPQVRRAVLNVNSPGGNVEGLFDTIAAIESFSKPLRVVASRAQSAAYALAAVGGRIEAAGPASSFGSIGVVAEFFVFEDEVSITNTDSPDKRPDVTTDEGKAVVRKHLDEINDLFTEAIARGRTASGNATTKAEVKADFGRGASLLAKQAKKARMVDRVATQRAVTSVGSEDDDLAISASAAADPAIEGEPTAADGGEDETMTLDELKAKHPALYNAIRQEGHDAASALTEAAVTAATDAERDRVNAHLISGEASGDMKTALKAIEDGSAMTQKLQASYFAAGMNRRDTDDRQGDADDASSASDDATPPAAGGKDFGDSVMDAYSRNNMGA